MTTTAVLVARMGSSRLPGKALKSVLGKPMFERLAERVRAAKSVDRIVLATSQLGQDDVLVDAAKALGLSVHRGSESDVLGRVHGAVQAVGGDVILDILGDNPLVHAELIEDVLAFFEPRTMDYAANVTLEYPHAPREMPRFPIGVRIQAYTPDALRRCESLVTDAFHREHSTDFMYEHPELFRIGYMPATGAWAPTSRPRWSLAVNFPDNLEMIQKVFEALYPRDPNFTLQEAVRFLDARPALLALMDPKWQSR